MNNFVSAFASLPLPLLICIASVIILRQKKSGALYTEGIASGISAVKGLIAPMLMLCISVKLITACGICDGISSLLTEMGIGGIIPEPLISLIITRPISGAAANASLNEIIRLCGASSPEVLCAALIMSSGDTCLYIYSTYFSVQSPKRGGAVLLLMLLVSLISVIICIFVCKAGFIS